MKEARSKRIPRTKLQGMSKTIDNWHIQPTPHVPFFNKIMGNVKLLQLSQESPTNIKNEQPFGRRFNISKRLQQLSKDKHYHLRNSLTARNIDNQPNKTNRTIIKNATTYNKTFISYKEPEDIELANLSKTINGTRLGALSSFAIMDQLAQQENKKTQQMLLINKKLVRLDSEGADEPTELQSESILFNRWGRKRGDKKKKQGKERSLQKLLQNILGVQQFSDKYKEYHMTLMERCELYKSKRLRLDYKNQWRI